MVLGLRQLHGARLASAAVGFVVALVLLIVMLAGWIGGYAKTDGGHVAVVRNGGPFDNNRIRQVIQPASNLTWTGLWSSVHDYPAQQRFYTCSSDPREGDRSGVDVINVPSQDGVDLGIEGTIYFTLNTDP